MTYIVYNTASWLINWSGALGFYLQPITLLHYDNITLEFVVLSSEYTQQFFTLCCQSAGSFQYDSTHPYAPYEDGVSVETLESWGISNGE